ncbi:MAG: hypothetical protein WB614_22765, partial [Pseudolabrys sp.]
MKGKAMSEIEDLKKELQALKDQLNPPPRQPSTWQPVDRTASMTMDPATMRRMAAVDTSGLQADLRAFQQQRSVTSSPAEPQRPRGTGWVEPRPLEAPPGIEHVDRLVDAQDRIDRAELIAKLTKG